MQRLTRILKTTLRIEGLDEPENRFLVRCALAIAVAAMVLRVFFWAYTGRVWEDSLITVLHSENFVQGLGMTHYNAGYEEPVHGFTSPLSVLVPLMGDVIRPGFGLIFIRIVSVLCGAIAVLYALGFAIHPQVKLARAPALLLMGYLAAEHCQLLWGVAGMETQISTAILLMTAYHALAWNPVALGIGLGLSMLARPDFGFWTLIIGAYILFKDYRQFAKIVAVSMALYAPWLLFTTLYYGSPVPHTILAKSLGYVLWWRDPDTSFAEALMIGLHRIGGFYEKHSIIQPLGPSFPGHGTAFVPVFNDWGLIAKAMAMLGVAGGVFAFRKRAWGLLPVAGFVLVYAVYYVFFVPFIFGWYVVPFAAMFMVLAAYGLDRCTRLAFKDARSRRAVQAVLVAGYLGVIVGVLPWTIHSEKRIQEDIENKVRIELGKFLGEVMKKDERVGIECLGYVGYYSRRTVLDWPGLATPEVVAYSRAHPEGRNIRDMFKTLEPEFIVTRERYGRLREVHPRWLQANYRLVRRFYVDRRKLRDIIHIEMNIDTSFVLYERLDRPGGLLPDHLRELTGLPKDLSEVLEQFWQR